jgi:hypothetical protein
MLLCEHPDWSIWADVRFGSNSEVRAGNREFRIALKKGLRQLSLSGPKSATTGREQMQQTTCANAAYSITSSARTGSVGGPVSPNALAAF